MADDITADVIIVGSGISGAIMAARLAASGVKVAILVEVDERRLTDGVDRYPEIGLRDLAEPSCGLTEEQPGWPTRE